MSDHSARWQFLDTGFQSGLENMRCDEELATQLQQGKIPPTLRVYGWEPWAISLGYHQQESDIDKRKCKNDGIDVVRRATGGRAILHANELTYSVVILADGRGVNVVYSDISKALVTGLKYLCSDVEYETSQPHFPTLYRKAESVSCFSSSARYEVQIKGKKLVGSAQRRFSSQDFPEVILQHGSILLGEEHKRLAHFLAIADDSMRQKIQNDFDEKTISLSETMGRQVLFTEVVNAVRSGFEEALGISFYAPTEVIV